MKFFEREAEEGQIINRREKVVEETEGDAVAEEIKKAKAANWLKERKVNRFGSHHGQKTL
jgi:hypothetical protein